MPEFFNIRRGGEGFECPPMCFFDAALLPTANSVDEVGSEAPTNTEEAKETAVEERGATSEGNVEPENSDSTGESHDNTENTTEANDSGNDTDPDTDPDTDSENANNDNAADDEASYVTEDLINSEEAETTLVVIDEKIDNYEDLVTSLPDGVAVLTIAEDEDGVETIAEYLLEASTTYTSIRVFSHGDEAAITLGKDVITDYYLENDEDLVLALESIGNSLSDDSTIVFYACDAASGSGDYEGEALLKEIAEITGSTVMGSVDDTGTGGDWNIEYSTDTSVTVSSLFTKDVKDSLNITLASLGSPVLRAQWTNAEGATYQIYTSNTSGMSWNQANSYATSITLSDGRTGYLANITSSAEYNEVLSRWRNVTQGYAAITGLNALDGSWGYNDGPEAGSNNEYVIWDMSGEASQSGENVAVLWGYQILQEWYDVLSDTGGMINMTGRAWKWHSWPNGYTSQGADAIIVEFDPIPEPQISVDSSSMIVNENEGPVLMFDNIDLSDSTSAGLQSYVIQVSNYDSTNVNIDWTNQAGITVAFTDNGDGSATISATGAGSFESYEALINSITCEALGEEPEQITMVTTHIATDTDGYSSDVLTCNVSINEIPDAPVLNITPNNTLYDADNDIIIIHEDQGVVSLFDAVTITDLDSEYLTSMTINISGYDIADLNLQTKDINGLTVLLDPNTGITISGIATLVDYETAILGITAEVLGEEPAEITVNMDFTVWDDTLNDTDDIGGDANGPLASNTEQIDIYINEIPDSPEITSLVINTNLETCDAGCIVLKEGAESIALFESVEINDLDSEYLTSLKFVVTGYVTGKIGLTIDEMVFPANLTYSFLDGVLTIEGDGTIEEYEAALISLKGQSIGADPSNIYFDIQITVQDDTVDNPSDLGGDSIGPLESEPFISCIQGLALPEEEYSTDNVAALASDNRFVAPLTYDSIEDIEILEYNDYLNITTTDHEHIYFLVTGDELALAAQTDSSLHDLYLTNQLGTIGSNMVLNKTADLAQELTTVPSVDRDYSAMVDEVHIQEFRKTHPGPLFNKDNIEMLTGNDKSELLTVSLNEARILKSD